MDMRTREEGEVATVRAPAPLRAAVVAAGALALLVALYAALGTWVAPRLIAREAKAWTERELGMPLGLGAVRVDPFRFTVDLEDLALPEAEPMVSARRLHLDFAVSTLFSRTRRFDSIRVEAPEVRAILEEDGKLNLARLIPPQDDSPVPSLLVADLVVEGGRALLRDETRAHRPEKWLDPIGFHLRDFRTDSEGGRFSLDASSARGERLSWQGTLSLDPVASDGRVQIRALEAGTVHDFFGDLLPGHLRDGRIDADLRYSAAYGADGARATASVADIALSGAMLSGKTRFHADVAAEAMRIGDLELAYVAPPDAEAAFTFAVGRVAASGLRATGTGPAAGERMALRELVLERLDLMAEEPSVGSVALVGLETAITRAPGGGLSLLRWLPERAAERKDGEQASTLALPAIGSLLVSDSEIRVQDRAVTPAASWILAPIRLAARAGEDGVLQVEGEARINQATRLVLAGEVAIAEPSADLAMRLTGLPLVSLVPYTIDYPALEIVSGIVSADGRVRYRDGSASFAGAATVADLELVETYGGTDLLRWKRLVLGGIEADARAVTIAQARLEQPYGTILVLADGTLNTQRLVTMNPEPLVTPAADAQGPPVRRTRAERRALARAQEEQKKLKAAEARAALAAPVRAPELPLRIARLELAGGTLDFADYSLRPNFAARIEGISGTVGNISNDPRTLARVDLKGFVIDRFSPVTIAGELTPFQYDRRTKVDLAFRNIELPVFNPYSGRYAGYAIARGKLTTELGYAIDNRALAASHHIVIDQLEWGEATDSQDKVPLPIRFATSLLKDRNGVITLDVPVTGTLDDPEFRMWPIIWKMVGNLMGRVVTAPFRALGNLFGGREDVEFIAFAPGDAAIPEEARANLAGIAQGLSEKPELRLDIPAGPALAVDAGALAQQRLAAAALAREAAKGQAATPEALAALPPGERLDRLETVWRQKRKTRPAWPEAEEEEDREARRTRRADWLEAELRADFAPADAELAALGRARAEAIRGVLVDAQTPVDPARIFLAANASGKEQDGRTRIELRLDAR
ncbi:MAG: DUF748 domain-containing protein [Sphingomonadaceae bacterium]